MGSSPPLCTLCCSCTKRGQRGCKDCSDLVAFYTRFAQAQMTAGVARLRTSPAASSGYCSVQGPADTRKLCWCNRVSEECDHFTEIAIPGPALGWGQLHPYDRTWRFSPTDATALYVTDQCHFPHFTEQNIGLLGPTRRL